MTVLWVVYRVVMLLLWAVVAVGGAGDAARWWWCCTWCGVMQVMSEFLGTDLSLDCE